MREEKRGLSYGAWFISFCAWYPCNRDVLSSCSQSRTLGSLERWTGIYTR